MADSDMPGNARSRYTTFLVAPTAEGGDDAARAVVYAVMTRGADEALAAVRALVDAPSALAIVGSLSTRTAKTLKLKPGEVRVV